jgi:transcriptional regulator with XRE-family HTH domain
MPRVGNPENRRRHFVREWRKFRGLTQEKLAEKLDTTKANISRIENLHQGYTQDFLEACAEVLKVDPAALLSENPLGDTVAAPKPGLRKARKRLRRAR